MQQSKEIWPSILIWSLLIKWGRNCAAIIYRTEQEHDHDQIQGLKAFSYHVTIKTVYNHNYLRGPQYLSKEAKAEAKTLFELKVKPKEMYAQLKDKRFAIKNIQQIRNFVTQLKNEKFGPARISLGQLEQLCIDNNLIPEDDDQAYVVSYKVIYEADIDDGEESDDENEEDESNKFR